MQYVNPQHHQCCLLFGECLQAHWTPSCFTSSCITATYTLLLLGNGTPSWSKPLLIGSVLILEVMWPLSNCTSWHSETQVGVLLSRDSFWLILTPRLHVCMIEIKSLMMLSLRKWSIMLLPMKGFLMPCCNGFTFSEAWHLPFTPLILMLTTVLLPVCQVVGWWVWSIPEHQFDIMDIILHNYLIIRAPVDNHTYDLLGHMGDPSLTFKGLLVDFLKGMGIPPQFIHTSTSSLQHRCGPDW